MSWLFLVEFYIVAAIIAAAAFEKIPPVLAGILVFLLIEGTFFVKGMDTAELVFPVIIVAGALLGNMVPNKITGAVIIGLSVCSAVYTDFFANESTFEDIVDSVQFNLLFIDVFVFAFSVLGLGIAGEIYTHEKINIFMTGYAIVSFPVYYLVIISFDDIFGGSVFSWYIFFNICYAAYIAAGLFLIFSKSICSNRKE
ncbi:MAG: hypothetical protein GX685_04130 [Clostridiales bacterium]|nr:hypothetical protein [Clostridiales bacterium]